MSGETLRIGAASTPAIAARPRPKPNIGVIHRSTSTPSARVSSARSVAARTTMPSRVRSMTNQTATETARQNTMTKRRYAGYVTGPRATVPASSSGVAYGWPCRPKRRRIPSWMRSVSPKVKRKPYSGSRPTRRRSSTRSSSMPARAITSGAMTSDGQNPMPACWSSTYATKAPSM